MGFQVDSLGEAGREPWAFFSDPYLRRTARKTVDLHREAHSFLNKMSLHELLLHLLVSDWSDNTAWPMKSMFTMFRLEVTNILV